MQEHVIAKSWHSPINIQAQSPKCGRVVGACKCPNPDTLCLDGCVEITGPILPASGDRVGILQKKATIANNTVYDAERKITCGSVLQSSVTQHPVIYCPGGPSKCNTSQMSESSQPSSPSIVQGLKSFRRSAIEASPLASVLGPTKASAMRSITGAH